MSNVLVTQFNDRKPAGATLRKIHTGISTDTDFLKGIFQTLDDSRIFDDDTANKLHNVFLDIDNWLALLILVSQAGCQQNALKNEIWIPAHGPLVDEDVAVEPKYADTLNIGSSEPNLDANESAQATEIINHKQDTGANIHNSNKRLTQNFSDDTELADRRDLVLNECDQNSYESDGGNDEYQSDLDRDVSKRASSTLSDTIEHKGENSSFKCDICKETFKHKRNLAQHLRNIRSGGKPFTCDICGAAICNKINVISHFKKRHFRIHFGEKQFKCYFCDKEFNQIKNMKTHLVIHSSEKRFVCDICGKAFKRNSHWRRHLKSHSTEKQVCNICGKLLKCNVSLKRHLAIHSGEKRFKCNICEYASNRNSNLKLHLSVHSGKKQFECDLCEKSFHSRTDLAKHFKVHSR